MRLRGPDVRELLAEQRLLEQVVAMARRWERPPPARVLDDVLAGTGGVRALLPAPRGPLS